MAADTNTLASTTTLIGACSTLSTVAYGAHFPYGEIKCLVFAKLLVSVRVGGNRDAGVPGEELPRPLPGSAESGADLLPGRPRGARGRNPVPAKAFKLDLATSQLVQRIERVGGQLMCSDYRHGIRLARRAKRLAPESRAMSHEAVDVNAAEIRKQISDRAIQILQGVLAGCHVRRNVGIAR